MYRKVISATIAPPKDHDSALLILVSCLLTPTTSPCD